MSAALGVRWTVGDVSSRGWEALRLSVHCAARLWGPSARYLVCVNSVPLALARENAGALPDSVEWRVVSSQDIPELLLPHLDPAMAEGVGWKLIPPRAFPGLHELSLDNDCILWNEPLRLHEFLERRDACGTAQTGDVEV